MEKLKEYLSGVTQTEFASRVGISPPYLSQILNDTRKPSFRVMTKIRDETEGFVSLESWAEQQEAAQ